MQPMPPRDPKERFSDRVENYIRYRPRYPAAVVELLRTECGLTSASIIADVGSGTGILSEMFLHNGNLVYGIEPNGPMREAAERLLAAFPSFRSLAASAEATTLADHSIDFVTAGQAFHWFDAAKARAEFARILRPRGWVVLVWNDRRTDSTPFLRDYERLLETRATDYLAVRHKDIDQEALSSFFEPGGLHLRSFENRQTFDLESLAGRLLSSSYAPAPGQSGHEEMLRELRQIFDRHQRAGAVTFEYDTKVYYGHVAPG
jgi:SAM-dependent methyltransferase